MALVKAIIFDMDGVLIEAKGWHYQALNRALGLFGLTISRYDHLVTYDGLPTRKKLEMLSLERGLPEALHPFISKMKQIYTMEYIYTQCKPVFHHQYALSLLKSAGMRLALASNAVRSSVDMMMEKADLARFFEFTLSNQDVVKPKPDPEIYLTAMSRLKLSPKECLVVEDNKNGIAAARASGAHVLVVKDTNDVTYERIAATLNSIGQNAQ